MRLALFLLLGVLALILLAGFGGALHPAGDTLALVRVPAAGASLLTALMLARPPRLAIGAMAGLSLLVLGGFGWSRLPGGAGGEIAIYQKNLWAGNVANGALIADIRASGADLVMLEEISDRNFPLLGLLEEDYPYQQFCRFSGRSGMAVLSRLPAIGEGICSDRRGMAGLRVEGQDGPLWALAIHLHWPWPHGQAGQVARMLPQIEALEGPVVVGGDFNMVPWGHSVARIARATGTRRAGQLFPTIYPRGVPLPIDYVLAPGGGSTECRPLLGSDHHGVLARVALR